MTILPGSDLQVPSDWELLKDSFATAVELRPVERAEFLRGLPIRAAMIEKLAILINDFEEANSFFSELTSEIRSLTVEQPLVQPGETLDGRFRVQRFLARGGMGEVYEVQDLELGGNLALKVMAPGLAAHPQSLLRFREEIRLARAVNSSNVCRVFDVARHVDSNHDFLFFTMELLEGETLADRLFRLGQLPLDQVRSIARQMIAGLAAAHRCGILHRDFKSSNVMLCRDKLEERVVLTDFGLSRRMEATEFEDMLDGGTPMYAAPEQLAGKGETPASDIFSVGVVLYEMTTGRLPAITQNNTIGAGRVDEQVTPPRQFRPDLPPSWDAAILRCIAADPQLRYTSVDELGRALDSSSRPSFSRRALWLAAVASVVPAALVWRGRERQASLARANPSIAVLPFSGAPEVRFMADGIVDRLTDVLGQLPGLRVISCSAPERLALETISATQAGLRLNAAYTLSGRVQAQGTQLRIHIELVKTSSSAAAWSNTYDIQQDQLVSIPDSVIRGIIPALALDVEPARISAVSTEQTANQQAYQLYLLGRFLAAKRDLPSLRESVVYFQRCVAIDPHFAAAFAASGFSYYQIALKDPPTAEENLTRARSATDTALAIRSDCADAYLVRAAIRQYSDWDWTGAEESYKQAIRVNPSLAAAHHWYARLLYPQRRFAEALREIQAASVLDPLDESPRIASGMILSYSGQNDRAIHEFRLLQAEDPGNGNLYVPLSCALEAGGRYGEALAAAARGVDVTGRSSFALSQMGHICALTGRDQEARSFLDELEKQYQTGVASASEVASVYMGWKDVENSFQWLERGLKTRDAMLTLMTVDTQFDFLRSDQRFRVLLSHVYPRGI